MKLFSIEDDNYHLECHLSQVFIDVDGQLEQRLGNYIVLIGDKCFEFPTSKKLYQFIENELDSLIDPLPF